MICPKTRVLVLAAEVEPDRLSKEALLRAFTQQDDPDQLIDLATDEGLACFLYRSLQRSGGLGRVSEKSLHRLQELYEQTVLFNLRLIHDLKELLSLLNHEGIKVILLQGMALLQGVYRGSVGLRPMTDIDLWVLGPQYGRVSDLLSELGYERHQAYPNTFARGATTFDLHSHLLWADRIKARRHLLRGGQDAIYREAVTVDVEGEEALLLSPRDQVLHLSLHAFKHNLKKLIWLVDIKLLLQRFAPSDWEGLHGRASTLGLKTHLEYALYLLRHLFRLDPPSGIRRLLAAGSMGMIGRRLLQRRVEGYRLPSWAPLWLLLPEKGVAKQISHILESSLPRTEVLRQVFVEYPERNRWRLYWMRILQLLGELRLALRNL
jgi:hypothetical protein